QRSTCLRIRKEQGISSGVFRRTYVLWERTVLGFDSGLNAMESLQRAVQGRLVMGRHHARAQERSAGRDGGMDGHVDVDAGVVEGAPEQHRLPVVADHDG